jgi:hypothetical protein
MCAALELFVAPSFNGKIDLHFTINKVDYLASDMGLHKRMVLDTHAFNLCSHHYHHLKRKPESE